MGHGFLQNFSRNFKKISTVNTGMVPRAITYKYEHICSKLMQSLYSDSFLVFTNVSKFKHFKRK